jgi:hypothetical protein
MRISIPLYHGYLRDPSYYWLRLSRFIRSGTGLVVPWGWVDNRSVVSPIVWSLVTREWWRRWYDHTRDPMFWYIVNTDTESLFFVLMYVLVSTGLYLQLPHVLYPSVISRRCRTLTCRGVLDEKGVLPMLFRGNSLLKWFGESKLFFIPLSFRPPSDSVFGTPSERLVWVSCPIGWKFVHPNRI